MTGKLGPEEFRALLDRDWPSSADQVFAVTRDWLGRGSIIAVYRRDGSAPGDALTMLVSYGTPGSVLGNVQLPPERIESWVLESIYDGTRLEVR
jgi:hypothetical protein